MDDWVTYYARRCPLACTSDCCFFAHSLGDCVQAREMWETANGRPFPFPLCFDWPAADCTCLAGNAYFRQALCLHEHCLEDVCSFAHSEKELKYWTQHASVPAQEPGRLKVFVKLSLL